MSVRAFTRAVALGAAASLLASGIAFADTVTPTGDALDPDVPGTVNLGNVSAGAVFNFDIGFTLACSGTKHVNSNQFVILNFSAIAPAGGDAQGTGSVIAPPGGGWPVDGTDCQNAPPPITADPSHVTITAPTAAGTYSYLLMWTRQLNPTAVGDSGTFTNATSVTVNLEVGGNVAPTVTVPSDMTVEGNIVGGATVTFVATASDPEDDPDPTVTCTPASGSAFSLGTTQVTCEATDSGGEIGSASFSVTVVDTTGPSLTVPADISVQTTDPSGSMVTYATPTATDVVDTAPTVSCAPPSGSTFPVGDTSVNCTAVDSAGNQTTRSFTVHVSLVQSHSWSAIFDEPVGDGGRLSTGGGRTIPVKVSVFLDGVAVTSGSPFLAVTRCSGGGPVATEPLTWGNGNQRWSGHLDTSGLTSGCYRVTVMVGGDAAGSFALDIGPSTAAAPKKAPLVTSSVSPSKKGANTRH